LFALDGRREIFDFENWFAHFVKFYNPVTK
jgi:hypothetical protein